MSSAAESKLNYLLKNGIIHTQKYKIIGIIRQFQRWFLK